MKTLFFVEMQAVYYVTSSDANAAMTFGETMAMCARNYPANYTRCRAFCLERFKEDLSPIGKEIFACPSGDSLVQVIRKKFDK